MMSIFCYISLTKNGVLVTYSYISSSTPQCFSTKAYIYSQNINVIYEHNILMPNTDPGPPALSYRHMFIIGEPSFPDILANEAI